MCYIDATKGFDKVNHWHLLCKLLDRNVPKCFVRLLTAWLTTQAFTARWGGVQTTSFIVTNGVGKGGILSPRLFAIYVDKLSEQLECSEVGCHINKQCMNHLFYADDAVLLAPTVDALQMYARILPGRGIWFITLKSRNALRLSLIPWVTCSPQMPT